ncbi:MAG: methyltransferase domain-containing protein [Anaerolineales bacterium]|nr:methyltransferase domain-containing protein [Anaerolineales bacterium]
MSQTLTLPDLTTIPDNIEDQLRRLLQAPRKPGLAEWLFELIKASGHLSTPDNLRWRVISMVWLAAEFDLEKAWPYLMWLNSGRPVISDHLAELLGDAANDLDCHVELANWIAQAKDERLVTFFSGFQHIPARYTMPQLVRRLLARPTAPEVGVWLATYGRATAGNTSLTLRPWRLLTAAWYATCFDPIAGLAPLRELSQGELVLSAADNKMLTDLAAELNCVTPVIQWLAACPDPAIKTMLKDFGHPDLAAFAAAIFQRPPHYEHLSDSVRHAKADVQAFKGTLKMLEQAGVSLKTAKILDLACGPLATQTLLFNSAGYKVTGADLHVPPAYLPAASLAQRLFQRGKYIKAWEAATAPYYQALAQYSGLKLRWNGLKIELADLTRLPFPESSFDGIVCLNHLQHAPDVESLLAEAARVLKPGGVLVADIIPYPALNGAFSPDGTQPYAAVTLNQWRESQYRDAFEKRFRVEVWEPEQAPQALANLTPGMQAELTGYMETELAPRRIMVTARKTG